MLTVLLTSFKFFHLAGLFLAVFKGFLCSLLLSCFPLSSISIYATCFEACLLLCYFKGSLPVYDDIFW